MWTIKLIENQNQNCTTIHCSVSIQLVMTMNLLNLSTYSSLLLISFAITEATLDISNLDLGNVKFFKYPQQTRTSGDIIYGRHQPFNLIDPVDNYNRIKAMAAYFAEVLLGGTKYKRDIVVYFHPDTGAQSRFNYQQKFGHRGERLVAALGNGFNKFDTVQHKKWSK